MYLSYYLSGNLFPGATPLDYAFIGGLTFGAAMIVAPLVTVFTRRTGLRIPMASGAIMLGGAFIAASYASEIWHLYLTQGVLVGMGIGFLYVPSLPVLSQWFSTRRSLANGISSAGSGIGGLIFSFAIGAMIDNLSLAWSLRIIGIITLFMNGLATAFIRDRNAAIQPKQRPFDRNLLRRGEVMLLLAWAFVSMLGYITLLYSLPDFILSIGLSRNRATQISAILNVGTAVGRPWIGVASDRLGRFEVASGLTLLCGLCCFAIWIPATSFGVTVLFALLAGAILGVFWLTIGPLCVEVAGLQHLPSLLALSWLSIVLPTTFSEVISLYLRRPSHDRPYLYTQIFSGLCYVIASVFLWFTRLKVKTRHRPPWPQRSKWRFL